jgi:hypothetical protein
MQGLDEAREKPGAQEQLETMEKTMRRTMGKTGNGAARASLPSGPSLFAGFVDEPGRDSHTLICAISTNSEHTQERNH